MQTSTTQTNHMQEIEQAGHVEPLQVFLHLFPVEPSSKEGNKVYFRFKNTQFANTWQRMAEKIIKAHNLPLEVEVGEWSRRNKVFAADLTVELTA